jgi:hypothetical protein
MEDFLPRAGLFLLSTGLAAVGLVVSFSSPAIGDQVGGVQLTVSGIVGMLLATAWTMDIHLRPPRTPPDDSPAEPTP